MAFRKRSDKQFDEFFGTEQHRPSTSLYRPQQETSPMDKKFPGRRSQAVYQRFGGQTGVVNDLPVGHDAPHRNAGYPYYADRAENQTEYRHMPMSSYRNELHDNGFEFERKPSRKGKRAVLWIAIAVVSLLLIAMTAFMLRPTDGGDYFRINGTLPPAENIRQTHAMDYSVWLNWDPVENVAGYRIYLNDNGHAKLVKTAYLSQTVIGGLEQGTHGSYVIHPFCTTENGEYEEPAALEFTLKTKTGDAGSLDHRDASESAVTLGWPAITGADGYELQRKGDGLFEWESCGESDASQIVIGALQPSTGYTFRMRPYVDIGTKRVYGGWSDKFVSATSPVTVTGLGQGETTDSGYMLTWSVGSEATGYELYRVDPQTGETTELIGQCGVGQYQISGLQSVTFSSYRVRAFLRHENGISYGEFSDVLTAVTLPTKVGGVDQYTAVDGTYTISWQPAERAEGYEIYAYSCNRDEYTLLTTAEESSFTLQDISQYAERYKIRAYVSLGDLKFFGAYSDELPCYPYAYLSRKVTVDKASTALRTGSGPEHELIKEVARGTAASVFAEKSGSDGSRWFRVELSDGMTGWLSREDVDITNTCKTLTTRTYTDDNPIVIYLSPSKQGGNPYIIGNTTEKEQMEAVAAVTHRILSEEYKCVVYTATPHLELRERAFEALELKADVYLAIHSNATGTKDVHYGASSYYCGASGRSKKLGESINKHLNDIAPKKCTLNKQMYSALESFGGVGYAEVRDPYNLGMVAVLAETDFHDNELTAQWIIDNHEAIGRAYAEALAETFDIDKK